MMLPTLLEGEAAVWLELSEEQQGNYATAKEKLSSAVMPMAVISLDKLHRWQITTRWSALHVIKKLLEQAMPSPDKPGHDQLLLHKFLSGLPKARSRIKADNCGLRATQKHWTVPSNELDSWWPPLVVTFMQNVICYTSIILGITRFWIMWVDFPDQMA